MFIHIWVSGVVQLRRSIQSQASREAFFIDKSSFDANIYPRLYSFGTSLATVVGSPEGAPAADINTAAEDLLNSIDRINSNLEEILSQRNFTA